MVLDQLFCDLMCTCLDADPGVLLAADAHAARRVALGAARLVPRAVGVRQPPRLVRHHGGGGGRSLWRMEMVGEIDIITQLTVSWFHTSQEISICCHSYVDVVTPRTAKPAAKMLACLRLLVLLPMIARRKQNHNSRSVKIRQSVMASIDVCLPCSPPFPRPPLPLKVCPSTH